MLKKLLGLIFNRWVLIALLLTVAQAALWLIGPLVAVGEWRPLDSSLARWVATGVLVGAVVAVLAWQAWRARQGNAQVVAQLVAAPTGPAAPSESADMASV